MALRAILRSELQPAGPTPLWNALGVAMTALLHQQGRRVVLVFTDGMDRPLNGSSHNVTFKDVVKRAEQEDVMIYGIGLAGSQPFGFGPGGGFGGYRGRGRGVEDKPDPGLEKLALASGGGYFELTAARDLSATFRVSSTSCIASICSDSCRRSWTASPQARGPRDGRRAHRARPQELRRGALTRFRLVRDGSPPTRGASGTASATPAAGRSASGTSASASGVPPSSAATSPVPVSTRAA